MIKRLANIAEMKSERFCSVMAEFNTLARTAGLTEYSTYSRLWEYPWLYLQLKNIKTGLRLLDIGSELSPMPWFFSTHGFDVIVSDWTARYWRRWSRASRMLDVCADMRVIDTQEIDLPTNSVDVCTSFSVFEHIPDKRKAVCELARVLRPGGILAMTFDICETDQGMNFPSWNGSAPTLKDMDQIFSESPWFEQGFSDLKWNTEDMEGFLSWNRTTAPHHNYVVGGMLIQRNAKEWNEPVRRELALKWKNRLRTAFSRTLWFVLPMPGTHAYSFCCSVTSILEKIRRAYRRGDMERDNKG